MKSHERKQVVDHVTKWMKEEYHPWPLSKACLYWADAVATRLRLSGIDACIQAGSMSWPRLKDEEDDGVIATHFSYIFEMSPVTINRLLSNQMPEMHVWAAIPDRNEIIDLTTGYLKQQCVETAGMQWSGPDPPQYIWCNIDRFPKGVVYEADIRAISLATQFLITTPEDRAPVEYFEKLMSSTLII